MARRVSQRRVTGLGPTRQQRAEERTRELILRREREERRRKGERLITDTERLEWMWGEPGRAYDLLCENKSAASLRAAIDEQIRRERAEPAAEAGADR